MSSPTADATANPHLEEALKRLFGKTPPPEVLKGWSAALANGMSAEAFLAKIATSPRFPDGRRIGTTFPTGHYYSPVVDPSTVTDYVANNMAAKPSDIAAIPLPLDAMKEFWIRHQALIAATPFGEQPNPRLRYYASGGPYPLGDALMLRTMLHAHRPHRIIEIGSGYSTACMLDTADEAGLSDLRITCIEPDPRRLRSILRPGDEARVTILDRVVQGIDLEPFRALRANDILFIDSTHVLKTGSDVHYELFHILPVLQPGVLVHFHDCRFPFEYPPSFIFEKNYSWNEAYALRAFLMWNNRFQVYFWNTLFTASFPALVRQTFPSMMRNPGSSIWLVVQG